MNFLKKYICTKKVLTKKIKPIVISNELINQIFPPEINDIIYQYIGPQINLDGLIQLNIILQNRQEEIIRNYTNDLFQKILN